MQKGDIHGKVAAGPLMALIHLFCAINIWCLRNWATSRRISDCPVHKNFGYFLFGPQFKTNILENNESPVMGRHILFWFLRLRFHLKKSKKNNNTLMSHSAFYKSVSRKQQPHCIRQDPLSLWQLSLSISLRVVDSKWLMRASSALMFALMTHSQAKLNRVCFVQQRPSLRMVHSVPYIHNNVYNIICVYFAVCELCTAGPACEGVNTLSHPNTHTRPMLHTLSQSPSEHRGRRAAAAAVDR